MPRCCMPTLMAEQCYVVHRLLHNLDTALDSSQLYITCTDTRWLTWCYGCAD